MSHTCKNAPHLETCGAFQKTRQLEKMRHTIYDEKCGTLFPANGGEALRDDSNNGCGED